MNDIPASLSRSWDVNRDLLLITLSQATSRHVQLCWPENLLSLLLANGEVDLLQNCIDRGTLCRIFVEHL